jgi:hypothetical protein
MGCNCNNNSNNDCRCGIFIDIYEGVTPYHTYYVNYSADCDGYSFQFNEGSVNNVFHEDNREVTVRYNSYLKRWEMVFYDNNLGGYVPFALYYTNDSACPAGPNGFLIGNCGWDVNRNVTYVKVDGIVVGVAVWNGERVNGYKVYEYLPSQYPGTYTTSFNITFNTSTNNWVINLAGVDIAFQNDPGAAQTNFPNGSFTVIAPFTGTVFLDTYNGLPPTPGNESPSGTLNQIAVRNIECGCCDTEVVVTIDGDEYTATVEYDEYGNVLGYGGLNYYTFAFEEVTYYLFYLNNQWVIKVSLGLVDPALAVFTSTNECPYGFYSSDFFTNLYIVGVECFDCCDYDTPKNRNLLKKKKAIFVDEISAIRNKEIFGFNCGPEWDDLFRKHLIFDVLWCLPYGKICDEEQQCLINNLNENCNC